MPKVTAIITTFNRANFVEIAIRSVLNQTFTDFELLVLDNSSRDNTTDIVASFDDPRIRYLKHEPIGISEQRNLGLKEARTPFVAFLDDDDIWMPTKLEDQYREITKSDQTALVYGKYFFFDDRMRGQEFGSQQRDNYLQALLSLSDGFCASASNPMIRVESVKSIGGYDETVGSGEDFLMYVNLSIDYQFRYFDRAVVAIRDHQGPRLAGLLDERIRLEERILERFYEEMSQSTRIFYFRKIAGKYIRNNNTVAGRRLLATALLRHGALFSLGTWAQLFLSTLGSAPYRFVHNRLIRRAQRRFDRAFDPNFS